jgi:Zn-dependent protease
MINLLFTDPAGFFVRAIALLLAITVHEFAHAWTAVRLGDPTPRLQRRLTLNPLAHLDPLGTLMLLFVNFGWGKPVQFDPYNLEKPRRDAALISLAGPFANLITAGILSLALHLSQYPFSPFAFLQNIFIPFIFLNVILAVFNLVPIHPLDGGKILVGILPREDAHKVDQFLSQYGIFLLFVLIFPIFSGESPIFYVLSPIINFLLSIYIPNAPLI